MMKTTVPCSRTLFFRERSTVVYHTLKYTESAAIQESCFRLNPWGREMMGQSNCVHRIENWADASSVTPSKIRVFGEVTVDNFVMLL